MKLKRRHVGGILFLAYLLAFFGLPYLQMRKMYHGYEKDPVEGGQFLRGALAGEFHLNGFQPDWVQGAWVNGFREHTYLYVVKPDLPEFRAELINTILEAGGTFEQRTFHYLGPSTAPDWWMTAKVDTEEGIFYYETDRYWRFTWIGDLLYVVMMDF